MVLDGRRLGIKRCASRETPRSKYGAVDRASQKNTVFAGHLKIR